MNDPKLIIIARLNEESKTTFAREFLLHEAACPVYLSADLMAAGMAPFAPKAVAIGAGLSCRKRSRPTSPRRQSFAFVTGTVVVNQREGQIERLRPTDEAVSIPVAGAVEVTHR